MTASCSRSAPPLELYDRPANVFVAGFIGSPTMNFIDGVVVSGKKSGVRLKDGSMVEVNARGVREGQAITLGMRPEHLLMSGTGISGEVLVVEPLGMTTQVSVKTADSLLTVMAMERTSVSPSDKVQLSIAPPNVHVFDKSTGNRVD